VLEASRRSLGERHADTTISAWNLFVTLLGQEAREAAGVIFARNLAWLLSAQLDDLGASQRTIRGYLAEMGAGSESSGGGQYAAGRGDKEEG
jgi:DNA-binding transcriptional regulator PaaX